MKPITPEEADIPLTPAALAQRRREKVVRFLNRRLMRGRRCMEVNVHLELAAAKGIADEFAANGWSVTLDDLRDEGLEVAWRFSFKPKVTKQG